MQVVAALFVFRKPDRIPTLKERHGDLAAGGEWLNTKGAIDGLLAKLRANPDDAKAKLLLAQGLHAGRPRDGRPHVLRPGCHAAAGAGADPGARKLRGAVLQSRALPHAAPFRPRASTWPSRAVALNPNNAFVYGLLCDANVELGHYDEAVRMADKMNQVRPDLRAYSRVSYLP